jgi:hypothetical protein
LFEVLQDVKTFELFQAKFCRLFAAMANRQLDTNKDMDMVADTVTDMGTNVNLDMDLATDMDMDTDMDTDIIMHRPWAWTWTLEFCKSIYCPGMSCAATS